jgi:hypothetical protein
MVSTARCGGGRRAFHWRLPEYHPRHRGPRPYPAGLPPYDAANDAFRSAIVDGQVIPQARKALDEPGYRIVTTDAETGAPVALAHQVDNNSSTRCSSARTGRSM